MMFSTAFCSESVITGKASQLIHIPRVLAAGPLLLVYLDAVVPNGARALVVTVHELPAPGARQGT